MHRRLCFTTPHLEHNISITAVERHFLPFQLGSCYSPLYSELSCSKAAYADTIVARYLFNHGRRLWIVWHPDLSVLWVRGSSLQLPIFVTVWNISWSPKDLTLEWNTRSLRTWPLDDPQYPCCCCYYRLAKVHDVPSFTAAGSQPQ
jgi:hypothetical protein